MHRCFLLAASLPPLHLSSSICTRKRVHDGVQQPPGVLITTKSNLPLPAAAAAINETTMRCVVGAKVAPEKIISG